ncbi:metal ABC transporter solute-binding protein, Zn/Mn family [Levilactobacillus bambusae]|nr:zinc ABC transporter substrate-binding protein [Levilactobacillus bambusae]
MRKRQLHFLTVSAVVLTVIFLGAVLTGCQQAAPTVTNGKKIHVATSLDFYGEAAKAVVGPYGDVTSIINSPSVDPDSYEPDTQSAKTVAKANVIVQNGLGYDSWMNRLVKANDKPEDDVITVGSLLGHHTGDNPHIWYAPEMMPKLVNQLVKQYSQLDPQHAAAFRRQGNAYLAKLTPVTTLQKSLRAKAANQRIATSEPVANYALTALGYQIVDPHYEKAIEEGADPTPADIKQVRGLISTHQIQFFVNNTQNTGASVTQLVQLANRSKTPVLRVTETLPKGKTYETWMLGMYRQIQKIQQQGGAH